MTIKVTPSDQLILNLDEAEDGELLQLHLVDGQSPVITTRQTDDGMDLFMDEWHMEPQLKAYARTEADKLFQNNPCEVAKWLEGNCPCGRDPYEYLYEIVTYRCRVTDWWVGKVPMIHLSGIFDDSLYQPRPWILGAKVQRFEAVEDWVGVARRYEISAALSSRTSA